MDKLFELTQVTLKGHELSFKANERAVTCDLAQISRTLAHASAEQVARMIVDPVGIGFHWPEPDEDLSVSGILKAQGIQVQPAIRATHQAESAFQLDKERELAALS